MKKVSEIAINETIVERRRIRAAINKIKRELEDATNQLRGTGYVWPRQITALARLRKDLNAQLKVLEEQYESLEECELDE